MARRRSKVERSTASGASRKPFKEDLHRREHGRFASKGGADAPATGRGSGSVARAHGIFEKLAGKPRAEVLRAAEAAGINRNTASTQFARWQRTRAQAEAAAAGPGATKAQLREAAGRALGLKPAAAPPKPGPTPAAKPPGGELRDQLNELIRDARGKPVNPNRFAMGEGERPTAYVHRIAGLMRDRPRADVIATAVQNGVNRSTASVQYSAWLRNQNTAAQHNAAAVAPAPQATPPLAPPLASPTAVRRRPSRSRTPAPSAPAPATRPPVAATQVRATVYHSDPAKRELIRDFTENKPKPGTPAARMHERLVRAASVFKGASFQAHYDGGGKLRSFKVERGDGMDGGPDSVYITRSFNLRQNSVDHSYFTIGEDERRSGAAKAFLAETVEAYKAAGIAKVTVHANIDVGGYAWLRYGFKPSEEYHTGLMQHVFSKLTDGSISGQLTSDEINHVKGLISQSRWQDMSILSKPIQSRNGTSSPLGRLLFLNSDWQGELDLNNKDQYDTFMSYAGAKR